MGHYTSAAGDPQIDGKPMGTPSNSIRVKWKHPPTRLEYLARSSGRLMASGKLDRNRDLKSGSGYAAFLSRNVVETQSSDEVKLSGETSMSSHPFRAAMSKM